MPQHGCDWSVMLLIYSMFTTQLNQQLSFNCFSCVTCLTFLKMDHNLVKHEGGWYTCSFCASVRHTAPVHSTTTAQSSHQDRRLSDRHHQGSMQGMKHHKHDPPESSSTSTAGFPIDEQTNQSTIQLFHHTFYHTLTHFSCSKLKFMISKWLITMSTCHTMTVVSLDPVASFVPSLENLQNQTSLQCSVRICWV